jgi:hypothetical protein
LAIPFYQPNPRCRHFLTTRSMLKWSNEVVTWSNEAFWLDDLQIHERRRACELREYQTSLIFAQAIASSEFRRRRVILIANLSHGHRSTWSTAATLSPIDRRFVVRKRSQTIATQSQAKIATVDPRLYASPCGKYFLTIFLMTSTRELTYRYALSTFSSLDMLFARWTR